MASFEKAVTKVFWLEGGYVNDPDDPGGETIYGITRRDHPEAWEHGRPTHDQAKALYAKLYWHPLWNNLAHDDLAGELLDYAVVAGQKTAILLLQRALNRLGWALEEDGIFGPKTLDAANITTLESVMVEFRTEQIIRAVKLGEEKPPLKKFLRGWIRRALL
jgi:lysozyme family protein